MLVIALTSWIIGGIVGLIAFGAASYVAPQLREEDLPYLTGEERQMRRRHWYKVGEVTRGFAGGTYGVVFLLLWFARQCRTDLDSGEAYSEGRCNSGEQ